MTKGCIFILFWATALVTSEAAAVGVESIPKLCSRHLTLDISRVNDVVIWGWAGPLPSPDAATNEAIANCKRRGRTDPHSKDQWRDYYHGYDKHV
jgi:hypothetical protein